MADPTHAIFIIAILCFFLDVKGKDTAETETDYPQFPVDGSI